MKRELLNEKILQVLNEKVPQKKDLTVLLAELLSIEKEAVYRRLRAEVPFSLEEAETLARKLDLSLDQLIGRSYRDFLPQSKKYPGEKTDNENDNYKALVNYVERLTEISAQSYSEHAHALHVLPLGLAIVYPNVLRFMVYEFFHLYGEAGRTRTFDSLVLSDKVMSQFEQMEYCFKNISNTRYIWDPWIIPLLADNIHYYKSINLIKEKEVQSLKKELLQLLNDLENYAITGNFKNTGNKFSLYVPNIHTGFTNGYLWSENCCMSIISTFVIQTIASFDEESFQETKERIQSLIKSSTLISIVGERERIDFFSKQRSFLENI